MEKVVGGVCISSDIRERKYRIKDDKEEKLLFFQLGEMYLENAYLGLMMSFLINLCHKWEGTPMHCIAMVMALLPLTN